MYFHRFLLKMIMMIIMELGWHEFFLAVHGNDGFSLELQIRDSTKNLMDKMDSFLVWYYCKNDLLALRD